MRKAVPLAVIVAVAWSMLHSASACGLNSEITQGSVVGADCGVLGCMFDPPQDPYTLLFERTPPDPARDCRAAYFDPGIYTGVDGLVVWQMATLGAESQYQPGAGFPPSPMDANAAYR
jgi:hypothetical protein